MRETDDELAELRERRRRELREAAERPETPDEPVHVGSVAEYDELVGEYDLVLADFYADWCGPCKQLEPIVERLAAGTDAAVLKVDVDELGELSERLNVRGIPALFVYADGELVEQVTGLRGEAQLRSLLERHA